MNADRIDYYANQLRGVLVADLGRKLREVLRDVANEAEASEREACAMVCEEQEVPDKILGAHPDYLEGKRMAFSQAASQIRARSNA